MKLSSNRWTVRILTLLIACVGITAKAADQHEPALSSAEAAIVSRHIATLKSPAERSIAEGWSNAKKVAEFLCRPAALPIIKKQVKGVDKVFLGTNDPQSLTLVKDGQLTGSGQFRTPQGWQDFTFECTLNPETGRVTDFHTVASKNHP